MDRILCSYIRATLNLNTGFTQSCFIKNILPGFILNYVFFCLCIVTPDHWLNTVCLFLMHLWAEFMSEFCMIEWLHQILQSLKQWTLHRFLPSTVIEHVCVLSCSVMSDSVTPRTVACQVPLSMEFFRQEYWDGLPLDLPESRIIPASLVSPALAEDFFTTEQPGKLIICA